MDDFFSARRTTLWKIFWQTAENRQPGQRLGTGGDGVYLQAAQAELWKLSEEERKWLKRITQKSDLLKNPKPQGDASKRDNKSDYMEVLVMKKVVTDNFSDCYLRCCRFFIFL